MNNPSFGKDPTFFSIAASPEVKRTAFKVAMVVGSVLCLINHMPALAMGTFGKMNLLQMLFTYSVPYCVSTYSSVKMIRRFVLQ